MNHIGQLIKSARKEQNISLSALYRGICSVSYGSKIENGEQIPNRLLFQALISRLGMNPGEFATMLSYPEYRYFMWKRDVCQALECGQWDEVELLLQKAEASEVKIQEGLQKQFYLWVQSVLEREEENIEISKKLVEQAIMLTLPEVHEIMGEVLLLSKMEYGLLMQLAELHLKNSQRKKANQLLGYLLQYANGKHCSDLEKAKRIIEIASLKVKYSVSTEKEENIALCKEALEQASEYRILNRVRELLEFLVKSGEEIYYYPQLKALNCVYQEYEKNSRDDFYYMQEDKQEVYLLHEMIKAERLNQGLSQERLSEGICEAESFSRIETGKRKPKMSHYRQIAKRLNIEIGFFEGRLDSEDYTALKLREHIGKSSSRNEPEKAWEYFLQLKNRQLVMTAKNRQYMEAIEANLLFRTGKINLEEMIEREKRALFLTVRKNQKWFWKTHFTRMEGEILNHIAIGLHIQGKTEMAVDLLEKLYCSYQESLTDLDDHIYVISVIQKNLCNYLSDIGRNEEAVRWGEEGIRSCIRNGDGLIAGYIADITYANENLKRFHKEKYKKWYCVGYYLCILYKRKDDAEAVKKYYEMKYGESFNGIFD